MGNLNNLQDCLGSPLHHLAIISFLLYCFSANSYLLEGRISTFPAPLPLHCRYHHYLQKRDIFNSQEIENLKNREAQHLIQWNLLMAEKESELSSLAAHQMDLAELDLLAESECGLAELTRDINNTTQQVKVRQFNTFI